MATVLVQPASGTVIKHGALTSPTMSNYFIISDYFYIILSLSVLFKTR
jgi:hypothetical protein